MSSHIVREIEISDALDIAASFNNQNEVWPGGFNAGKELTADEVRRWVETSNAIAIYVSVEDNHAHGYCSLLKNITDEADSCYVGLLGLNPVYHGKGHGRDLLRASITKAIEHKLRRVDLHTWAANLKAVPLYKKTGFMWIPETGVYMQNYIPMIVLTPLAADFFSGIDWYSTHERVLEVAEDSVEWERMKVFEYSFRRDDRKLRVKINRFSREIVYFENDDLCICLKPSGTKPLRGRTLKMRLDVINKSGIKTQLILSGFGAKGISSDFHSDVALEKNLSVDVPFAIGHETTRLSNYDKYPTAGVDVKVNGKSVQLGIGYETKSVIDVSVYPQYAIISKGVMSPVRIELTNNAERDISGTLLIPDIKGAEIHPDEMSFSIPFESKKSINARIKSDNSFAIPVQIDYQLNGETGKTAETELPVVVSDPFSYSYLKSKDKDYFKPQISLSKFGRILITKSRGGISEIIDPVSERVLMNVNSISFGPPFEPSMMSYTAYDLDVNPDGSIELKALSDKNPEILHIKRIDLLDGNWVSVRNSIRNTGSTSLQAGFKAYIRQSGWWGAMMFPVGGRIISGMVVEDNFPRDGEYPENRSDLSEGWLSLENETGVYGFVFGENIGKMGQGWRGSTFEFQIGSIKPGETLHTEPIYAYAGPGDYRIIRNGWFSFFKGQPGRHEEIEVQKLRTLYTVPEIPVVSDQTEVDVCFDNLRLAPADGEILLSSDKTIKPGKSSMKFEGTVRDSIFSGKVKLKSKKESVGASILNLRLNSPAGSAETDTLVLRVDPEKKVKISQEKSEYVISNDLLSFRVDPDFGAGIHSINSFDQEWLRSPYPDKNAMFCWYNPWRGGVRPRLRTKDEWLDNTFKETWTISEVSETVGSVKFTGVETRSEIQVLEPLKGVAVRTRYLLSEGHRILRVAFIVDNLFDVAWHHRGGLEFFLNVHPENKTRQRFDYGYDTEQKAGPFAGFRAVNKWVITENDENHRCLLILFNRFNSLEGQLYMADHGGSYGQHVLSDLQVNLGGCESKRWDYYITPCNDLDEAMKLRGLLNLK
jgi:ribosomal protein S18 acetylase RimI-like enzyme